MSLNRFKRGTYRDPMAVLSALLVASCAWKFLSDRKVAQRTVLREKEIDSSTYCATLIKSETPSVATWASATAVIAYSDKNLPGHARSHLSAIRALVNAFDRRAGETYARDAVFTALQQRYQNDFNDRTEYYYYEFKPRLTAESFLIGMDLGFKPQSHLLEPHLYLIKISKCIGQHTDLFVAECKQKRATE